jgi:putative OPT family oligopeptide transporter
VSFFLFFGGALAWLVLMPAFYLIGSMTNEPFYPATLPMAELKSWDIFRYYIRYIGAGMVVFCGFMALVNTAGIMGSALKAFRKTKMSKSERKTTLRTDKDIPSKIIVIVVVVAVMTAGLSPTIPVGLGGAFFIAFFGFFFATVSSRIVGVVGSSNNPISGMTIASIVATGFIFKLTGHDGPAGMLAVTAVGCVICIAAATAGDMSQGLKTGYILGATPVKQQTGELLGIAVSGLVMGGILILLHKAWGFGSDELAAPQASLMKLIVEGIMGNRFPLTLIMGGIAMGLLFTLFRFPVFAMAVGMCLPVHLTSTLFLGGIINWITERKLIKANEPASVINSSYERGVLFSSGMVAGEGIVGIFIAVLAVLEINVAIGNEPLMGKLTYLCAYAFLCWCLIKAVNYNKNSK